MKNIANMLGRADLTPRQRYLMLIHNDIQKAKTGKDILTEADKKALENWKAYTNEEAREWNQLNEGWRYSGRLNIEAELAYKDARIAHLSNLPIILSMFFYPGDRRMGMSIESLKGIKKVSINEAIAITQKQKAAKLSEGIDFDYAVYQLAFELLSPEDRKALNDLYADVETDHQYLDQEEIIAHLYGGKEKLGDEGKDKLAELVAEQSYNKFAKEYQLFHYFACIPLAEVARYFLKTHGIEIAGNPLSKNQEANDGDEDTLDAVTKAMQTYADEHETTIKALLRKGCREWLDSGLIEEYLPLAASNNKELLERWLATKIAARKIILRHIASGELALRDRTPEESRKEKLWSKNLYDHEFEEAKRTLAALNLEPITKGELDEKTAFETFSDKVVTGESLYVFKGDYEFIKDFKKRVDEYDPNLGLVYAESDPEQKGDHLDQELLISDILPGGEPAPFSPHGINVAILTGLHRGRSLFEEHRKDGKIWIKFKDANTEKIFMERRQIIIDGYATLLAFLKIFQKLTPIYETDMAEHVTQRLAALKEDIEGQHNKAVHIATHPEEQPRNSFLREREPMQFEEDLMIDIAAIMPDLKTLEEQSAKVKEIFPSILLD